MIYILKLTCEHCGQRTALCVDRNSTEDKCANGECGKISRHNEQEKTEAYIAALQLEMSRIDTKLNELRTVADAFLVRTPGGHRLVQANDFNSMQWALTATVDHLKT